MSRQRHFGYDRDYADCVLCDEVIYRRHDWGPEHWVHLDVVRAHLAYPSESDIARLAAEAPSSGEPPRAAQQPVTGEEYPPAQTD